MNLPDTNELNLFIVKAKANSYVGEAQKSLSYRPASRDIQFHEGRFSYIDSYFGGIDFLGQEVVYFDQAPVWAMNYYGRILQPELIDSSRAVKIIMESLSKLYREGRFLGGFENDAPLGKYIDTNQGDLFSFKGYEWIEVLGQKSYELVYHGGVIK